MKRTKVRTMTTKISMPPSVAKWLEDKADLSNGGLESWIEEALGGALEREVQQLVQSDPASDDAKRWVKKAEKLDKLNLMDCFIVSEACFEDAK